jgi:hypothetical protein
MESGHHGLGLSRSSILTTRDWLSGERSPRRTIIPWLHSTVTPMRAARRKAGSPRQPIASGVGLEPQAGNGGEGEGRPGTMRFVEGG